MFWRRWFAVSGNAPARQRLTEEELRVEIERLYEPGDDNERLRKLYAAGDQAVLALIPTLYDPRITSIRFDEGKRWYSGAKTPLDRICRVLSGKNLPPAASRFANADSRPADEGRTAWNRGIDSSLIRSLFKGRAGFVSEGVRDRGSAGRPARPLHARPSRGFRRPGLSRSPLSQGNFRSTWPPKSAIVTGLPLRTAAAAAP